MARYEIVGTEQRDGVTFYLIDNTEALIPEPGMPMRFRTREQAQRHADWLNGRDRLRDKLRPKR